jgi:hypothetical protein
MDSDSHQQRRCSDQENSEVEDEQSGMLAKLPKVEMLLNDSLEFNSGSQQMCCCENVMSGRDVD